MIGATDCDEATSPYPHDTLAGILRAQAPHATAFIDATGKRLSYGQLCDLLHDSAAQFGALGLGRQARVALVTLGDCMGAVAALAVLNALVCMPLRREQTSPEFRAALTALRADALLLDERLGVCPASEVAGELGIPVFYLRPGADGLAGSYTLVGTAVGPACVARPADAADMALIMTTSGTTGSAKLVPHTQRSLSHAGQGTAQALGLTADDRLLNFLPQVHVHGLVSALLVPLSRGSSIVCVGELQADRFIDWLERFRPTWYTASPPMHKLLHDVLSRHAGEPLRHRLRFIRSGAMPLARPLAESLEGRLGVPMIEAYGMTEVPNIAGNPLAAPRLGSVGRSAGPEIAIWDDRGVALPADSVGRIMVRGSSVMPGYLEQGEADSPVFRDGWFPTGDLGCLDAHGYLYVQGRQDDIIIRGGDKLMPAEVDALLLLHPAVREAVCYPVPHPVLGHDMFAAVVLQAPDAATEQALMQHLTTRLAVYRRPTAIHLVSQIPVGPTGKPRRGLLHAQLADAGQPSRLAADRLTATESLVAQVWGEVLGHRPVAATDHFFELGGTSLDVAQVAARFEQLLAEPLHMPAVIEHPRVATFATFLTTHYWQPLQRLLGDAASVMPALRPTSNQPDSIAMARFRSVFSAVRRQRSAAPDRRNPRAIFILSPPRSGSTLLRVMLAGHPALFAPPELRLLHYTTLRDWQQAHQGSHAFFQEGVLAAIMAAWHEPLEQAESRLQAWLDADRSTAWVIAEIQTAIGARILVDKSPRYAMDPAALSRMKLEFEDALFIHLVRHPAACVSSFERGHHDQLWRGEQGELSPRQMGELLWHDSHANILDFLADVPEHRQCAVRYEALVSDPQQVLGGLCRQLGLPFDAALLDPYQDPQRRMIDAVRQGSRPVGDVRFLQHGQVSPQLAHHWVGRFAPECLSASTWTLAARLEHRLCGDPPPVDKPVAMPGLAGATETPIGTVLDRIALLVRAWQGTRPFADSLLVASHAAGRRRPLFWCFQGEVEFRALAGALGPEQPLYAMRSGHMVMEKSAAQVRALAQRYAEQIQRVQPQGPYQIGGNCQAGRIAFEIALALRASGQQVAILCLMEVVIARPYPGRVASLFGETSTAYNPYFTRHMPELIWRAHYGAHSVDIIAGGHGDFFKPENVGSLAARLTVRLDETVEQQREQPDAALG